MARCSARDDRKYNLCCSHGFYNNRNCKGGNLVKIQPKENYRCVVYSKPPLDKTKTYVADIATNQPNYKEQGLIFCNGFLLNKNEYILKESKDATS